MWYVCYYTLGPPLLHAITGASLYMASTGTIPKCSLSGVYSTAKQFLKSQALCKYEPLTTSPHRRRSSWSSRTLRCPSCWRNRSTPRSDPCSPECDPRNHLQSPVEHFRNSHPWSLTNECCCTALSLVRNNLNECKAKSMFFFRSYRLRDTKKPFFSSRLSCRFNYGIDCSSNFLKSMAGYST